MAEGDTGAPRSGGAAQGDAFTKRETASEDYYVRQQELEKLRQRKAKLEEDHKKQSDDLGKQIAELEKKS